MDAKGTGRCPTFTPKDEEKPKQKKKTSEQYMCWDSKRTLLKMKWQTSPLESTCSGLDELQWEVKEAPGE
jgi:hypothetical protein